MSTKKNVGPMGLQNWATPWPLFRCLDATFGPFTLDVCAEEWSTKCPTRYYTKEDDGLKQKWNLDVGFEGKFFCNPEFNNISPWLAKGYSHARYHGTSGLFVLPSNTDVAWFHDLAALGDLVFLRRRTNFVPPPGYVFPPDPKTGKPKKSGNNTATLIVYFDPEGIKLPEDRDGDAMELSVLSWQPDLKPYLEDET